MTNKEIEEAVANVFATLTVDLAEVVNKVIEDKGQVWDESEYELPHDQILTGTNKLKLAMIKYFTELAKPAPSLEV